MTGTSTAATRPGRLVITNTSEIPVPFFISRKPGSKIAGNPPWNFNGRRPQIEITYQLDGKTLNGEKPGQVSLAAGGTARVEMQARILGPKPLAFGRTLITPARAESAQIVPGSRFRRSMSSRPKFRHPTPP